MNSHIRMRRHARLMLGCCLGIAFLASGLPPETSMAEDTKGCPRWISVMPLAEDDVDGVASDAVAQGDETIVDGIAWITRLCPEGNPAADIAAQYAAAYRKIEPKVRSQIEGPRGGLHFCRDFVVIWQDIFRVPGGGPCGGDLGAGS